MAEWEAALPKLKVAYKAWNDSKGGSIDTWLDLVDDGIDFRSLASGAHGVPWTQNRTTREEVRGYLTALTGDFAMEYFRTDRFVCQDDTIVMIGQTAWRSRKTDKRLETPMVVVWRFKNGKAVSFFEYYDTAMVASCAC